jgi:hypothetical protein
MIFKMKPCIFIIVSFAGLYTSAGLSQEQAGKTLLAKGKVVALSLDTSKVRSLKRRTPIYKIDQVSTSDASQAQLKMIDGALLALKENTALNIEEYFSNNNGQGGSVVMELVSGGLRTITGTIKGNSNNYKLKTPVGSIGIRGTHYEVELVNGELFMAVWDGSIEISGSLFSEPVVLGNEGSHAYAKISNTGEINRLLKPPVELSSLSGQANEQSERASEKIADFAASVAKESRSGITVQSNEQTVIVENIKKAIEETSFINEEALDSLAIENTENLIAERTGVFEYSNLENFSLTSTEGNISDFEIKINVDFDNGTVPLGQMSFNDNAGEWFATFNGLINSQGMELGVNYASHGQNLAAGDIQAQFSDQLSKIRGSFELYEIENAAQRAGGLFVVKEK